MNAAAGDPKQLPGGGALTLSRSSLCPSFIVGTGMSAPSGAVIVSVSFLLLILPISSGENRVFGTSELLDAAPE